MYRALPGGAWSAARPRPGPWPRGARLPLAWAPTPPPRPCRWAASTWTTRSARPRSPGRVRRRDQPRGPGRAPAAAARPDGAPAEQAGGVVAEGRDITTVVAPDADVRVLLTASEEARLRRRAAELHGTVDEAAVEATRDQVLRRDRDDSTVAPFTVAADGVVTSTPPTWTSRRRSRRCSTSSPRDRGDAPSPMTHSEASPRPRPPGDRGSALASGGSSSRSCTRRATGARTCPPAARWCSRPTTPASSTVPLLLGVAPRPWHFLVKRGDVRGPRRLDAARSGQIPLDQGSGGRGRWAGARVLKRGGVVGIFPEGSRGRGDLAAPSGGGLARPQRGRRWCRSRASAPGAPASSRARGRGCGRGWSSTSVEPVVIGLPERAAGSGRLELATEEIRAALVAARARSGGTHGIPLPTDEPPGRSPD